MARAAGERVVLCHSRDEAAAVVASGRHAVWVVAPGEVPDLSSVRSAGPGRVAVLVADPADPSTPSVAAEMGGEVFGRPDA